MATAAPPEKTIATAAVKASTPTNASTARPTQRADAGYRRSCTPGGLITDRMIGWSVTTLTKMEMTQKLEKTATFWMSGIGAIATIRMAKPSARMDAIAGGKRCEYDSTIAVCLSWVRWYSS